MKIAYVSNYFWPVTGGIEQSMLDTAREMINRGHEVSVHCSDIMPNLRKLEPYEELEGIQIFRYPYRVRVGYYTSLFLPKIRDADILHLHGFGILTNDYLIRRYHNKMPVLFSLRHGVKIPTEKILNKIYHKVYLYTVGLRSLKLVDKISPDQELDIMRLEKMGIQREKIEEVPPFVNDEILGKQWKTTEKPFGRYIIFLGRLHIEKSPEHLILAMKKLMREDVGIIFVGPDDGEMENLKKLAVRCGLENRVKFLGRVDEETKYGLLSGADFLVLPSMYEAFGIVILESWAMGKPVIATRVGGIPYFVSDGVDGILYEWGDVDTLAKKIEFLLENEDLRKNMGQLGRKKIEEKYTRTKVVDKIERIYKELLEG